MSTVAPERTAAPAPRADGAGSFAPRNALLNLLHPADLDQLLPLLRPVELKPRQVLHHWGMPMQHVYFIESGLVSVTARLSDDAFVEVWLSGAEGMTGIPAVLGDHDDPPHRRVVQVGGAGLRIATPDLRDAIRGLPSLRNVLLQYTQLVLLQTSQSGACNAHHDVKQRIARWLLLARDALGSDSLPLTHEVMGRLLGIRRASVSESLGLLEAAQVVETRRGMIRLVDTASLERIACDCYRIIRREHRRLLADTARRAQRAEARGHIDRARHGDGATRTGAG